MSTERIVQGMNRPMCTGNKTSWERKSINLVGNIWQKSAINYTTTVTGIGTQHGSVPGGFTSVTGSVFTF